MNKNFFEHGSYRNEMLKVSMVSTVLIGLIAHGYAFLNFFPSHDYLNEFVMDGRWQIELGRFLVPAYKAVFGTFSLPWPSGLVSLVWMGLAVFLLADIFQLRRKYQIAILSGIVVTNITITALAATYIPGIGQDTLALLMAVSACWCWWQYETKEKKFRTFLAGCICIVISLGLYQAYIAVFVTLIVIISILCLLENVDKRSYWKTTLFRALRAVGMTALGGCGYAIALKLVCLTQHISLNNGSYNSVTNAWQNAEPIYSRILWAYIETAGAFVMTHGNAYPDYIPRMIHILLLAIGICVGVGMLVQAIKRGASKKNILFIVLMVGFLPMSMNCIRLLNSSVHQLMQFAFWFFYIFVWILAMQYAEKRKKVHIVKYVCGLLVAIIIVNIQTSNAAYVKKDIEQQTTLSIMTRVVDRIEEQENYVAGKTKVAFVGMPLSYTTADNRLQDLTGITGEYNRTAISYYGVYEKYFENILQTPINLVNREDAVEISKRKDIQEMPCFPERGSIVCDNGVVVVKFSDESDW